MPNQPYQSIYLPYLGDYLADKPMQQGIQGIAITVKRIDLVHPTISGNKYYKLKYNLQAAKQQGADTLLSFGGAYSNHIHALAYAGAEQDFATVGIIRGAELANKALNPTLQDAKNQGMTLEFVSRETYRQKDTPAFLQTLTERYPRAYILPEGGSNALAVKGCQEILSDADRQDYDVIVCAVGTGATLAGIINASGKQQQVLGISVLAGTFQTDVITQHTDRRNWQLVSTPWSYGKHDTRQQAFIEQMQNEQNLPLDGIYTGKVLYHLANYYPQLLADVSLSKNKPSTNEIGKHNVNR